jgi:hypothetical protein
MVVQTVEGWHYSGPLPCKTDLIFPILRKRKIYVNLTSYIDIVVICSFSLLWAAYLREIKKLQDFMANFSCLKKEDGMKKRLLVGLVTGLFLAGMVGVASADVIASFEMGGGTPIMMIMTFLLVSVILILQIGLFS